jgi:hypothetical protein
MFSNLTVGIIMGIGIGGWVYMKLQRYTGGNAQSSATGAALCGVVAAIIVTTLLGLLF